LIPRRNMSLLSNRLAAGGGLRIGEDVLERDYCFAWFLSGLSESDLRPTPAFKDLDFTLREPLAFEDIRARLERVYSFDRQ
jgi:hypothetical protein